MTEQSTVDHYKYLKDQKLELQSHYMRSVRDDIACEIALGTTKTLSCVVKFFKLSFFFVRFISGS